MRTALIVLLMLLAAACSGDDGAGGEGAEASGEASVSFGGLEDGAEVSSPVAVDFEAEGFEIEEAGSVNEGAGHMHVMVDVGCVAVGEVIPADDDHIHYGDGSTSTELQLEPGEHTLCLQAGDGGHTALDLTDEVTITVSLTGQRLTGQLLIGRLLIGSVTSGRPTAGQEHRGPVRRCTRSPPRLCAATSRGSTTSRPSTAPDLPRRSRHPLLRLTGRLRPIAWQAAGAYGAMLTASGIALVVPLALRDVIDAAIGERPDALAFLPGGMSDRGRLLAGAGIVVALALVRALVSFWQRYGTAWVGRTLATDLRGDLMAHLLDSEMAFHDSASVGQLMTRVTDDTEQVRAFAATGVADLANILALMVGTSVLLWTIDPVLAPLALGAIPVVAVMAVIGARMLTPRFKALQKARGGLSAMLQESLAQVRVVQAFRAERDISAGYDADNEQVFHRRMSLARIFTTIFPAMSAVLGLSTALVLLVGGQRVAAGTATVGTIVAFTTYIVLLGEPVRRLGFLLNLAARASASATRVYELLDREVGLADAAPPARSGPASPMGEDRHDPLEGRDAEDRTAADDGVEAHIRWEDVTFTYARASAPVLRDVSLTVPRGQHLAVVGLSGSGKTTLVSLLTRLYDPDEGQVVIDGVDLRDMERSDLRRTVAVVEQDVWLFSAPVIDNIRFATPGATREAVEAAARSAGAHDFISRLPEGYDTVVGERGVTLSGGQRQRLALARAILVDAPVLVLDDAVSAVDARTEGMIRQALADRADGRPRPTIISVAQRLSTILSADRIVVVDHGRIVEDGTHEELIDAEGPYAAMFRTSLRTTGAASATTGVRGTASTTAPGDPDRTGATDDPSSMRVGTP